MAAIAAETARGARASGDVFTGALLASGAAALFVGTLFYAGLTPELGLPALPAERTQALADALKLGPQPLALAGGFAFLGDCLLLAACIALASRSPRSSNVDTAGWALIAVSVALAAVFDSMTGRCSSPWRTAPTRPRSSRSSRGSTFCSPPATFLTGSASSPSCARTSAAAGRCCRGLCRMSGSLSEPRRRSAVSARRSASCFCRLSSV